MLIQINSRSNNIHIIQAYAPTLQSTEEEIEINKDLHHTKKCKVNIILRDFNVKVGRGREADIVWEYGHGHI